MEVGDVVRIKSWDDMVYEYGCDDDGDIKLGKAKWFFAENKELCGSKCRILQKGVAGMRLKVVEIGCEHLYRGRWMWAEALEEIKNKTADESVGIVSNFLTEFSVVG